MRKKLFAIGAVSTLIKIGVLTVLVLSGNGCAAGTFVMTPASQIARQFDTRTWVTVLNNSPATVCYVQDSRGTVIGEPVKQGQTVSFPLGTYQGSEVILARCYSGEGEEAKYMGYDQTQVYSNPGQPQPYGWVISYIRTPGR